MSALRSVVDAELKRDIVTLNIVQRVDVTEDADTPQGRRGVVELKLPARLASTRELLRKQVEEAVLAAGMAPEVRIDVPLTGGGDAGGGDADQDRSARPESLSRVRDVIAVGAGKGGVGKSTVAINLAVGLARGGEQVGLLDGDIYGPSLPTLLGTDRLEPRVQGKTLIPFETHGVRAMTIGALVEDDRPLIWRGPMAHGAFNQLVTQTAWGELDTLIVDLPPGTGDVPLTMSQTMPLTGAVVVCTPQKVAQDDARRAVAMFRQLQVDVLGVVENMSYFIGDDGKTYDLFGRGGAELMAKQMGLPFLGAVPINMNLRRHGDAGDPSANFTADPSLREPLEHMVRQVRHQVTVSRATMSGPTLTVR